MYARVKLGLVMVAMLLVAACSSEPRQTQPVSSTSGSGTSTAPPAKEVAERNKALVRVINAVPGNTSYDLFAGDQKAFESVAFKSVTPYKELPDDRLSFHLRPAGQDSAQPLAENTEGLSGGKHYTVVIMSDANDKPTLYVFNDNITTPPADVAQVRVIHASPDAGEVDIINKQGNKPLFSGVNFEKETSYVDVAPTSTVLEIRQEGQDKPIVVVPNTKFEKGKFYTIVVTGRAKGTPKLQTVVVEDQLVGAPTASAKPTQDEQVVKTKATKYK